MGLANKTAAIILAMGISLPGAANAEEYKKEGWKIPNIATAKQIGDPKLKDLISEIPGKETTLTIYKTLKGTFFNSLERNGRLFGFYVDENGKPPMEYTLIDRAGDGVFRHKYSKIDIDTPKYLLP